MTIMKRKKRIYLKWDPFGFFVSSLRADAGTEKGREKGVISLHRRLEPGEAAGLCLSAVRAAGGRRRREGRRRRGTSAIPSSERGEGSAGVLRCWAGAGCAGRDTASPAPRRAAAEHQHRGQSRARAGRGGDACLCRCLSVCPGACSALRTAPGPAPGPGRERCLCLCACVCVSVCLCMFSTAAGGSGGGRAAAPCGSASPAPGLPPRTRDWEAIPGWQAALLPDSRTGPRARAVVVVQLRVRNKI